LDKLIRAEDGRLMFKCPGCNGIHAVTEEIWEFNGDLEKPTIRPSILSKFTPSAEGIERKICHSFVTEGRIRFLNDCTHSLAGKTVSLVDVSEENYNMELVEKLRGGPDHE
jgi:hypothetical protein